MKAVLPKGTVHGAWRPASTCGRCGRGADFSALLGVTAWGLLRPGAVAFQVILSSL